MGTCDSSWPIVLALRLYACVDASAGRAMHLPHSLFHTGLVHGWAVSSFWVHDSPPPPCPPGPLSYQGSIATGHTYGGAERARKFFAFPLPT